MNLRGTEFQPKNRFEKIDLTVDEYCSVEDSNDSPRTEFYWDDTQSIVTQNKSPDIPFRYSLNPYRGCEHGCAYCYARTSHEYLGWNAGLDFESKILVKSNAASLFRDWLVRPAWSGQEHVMLSGVTDPYQPIERKLRVTRSLLEVCVEARQAVSIITKNALVTRDLDLLCQLASCRAASVTLSITSLDKSLARVLEPRCTVPEGKLKAIEQLKEAGIPVHVNIAPIIPGVNDFEIPTILEAAANAGATSASWILVRLPGSVEPVFTDWLERHLPNKKTMVLNRIRELRGGKLHDPRFGTRMRGEGFFSDEWSQLFRVLRRKLHLTESPAPLNTAEFRRPRTGDGQLFLF